MAVTQIRQETANCAYIERWGDEKLNRIRYAREKSAALCSTARRCIGRPYTGGDHLAPKLGVRAEFAVILSGANNLGSNLHEFPRIQTN